MASEISFTNPFEPAGPGNKFPKSSISYHNSALRERNTQKQRPLVIVIPPNILLQSAHTNPRQRLSQGTLMPLYPTMYAQLTAIAREFNFPSTVGLCIYLHYSENGATVTPRISDESWHSLWNFAFENPLPSARVLHISGTIEFDVDLRQARWYPSWVSLALRDSFDLPLSAYPNTAVPDSHKRGDSQTTVYNEHAGDQRHQSVTPASLQRLFPRKLSLVERFDVGSPKTLLQPASSFPEKPALINALSPIAQESKPSMVRQELIARVQSWQHDNSSLELTPLAETKQHGFEAANVDVPPGASDALKPEEYAWSITSVGPDDRDSPVFAGSERLPSIYLEHRLIGSVCSTPSVCTSSGPFDYGFDSPAMELHGLPSPDLAHRAIDNAPLTPVTASTWGPSSSFPSSPSTSSYAASVDIGCRHILSPPLSASTATSWGPPLSDPPSPVIFSAPPTPDIGLRAFDGIDVTSLWFRSWQRDVERPPLPGNSHRSYPYLNIYPAVYPFFDLYPAVVGDSPTTLFIGQTANHHAISVTLNQYPSFNLYPSVYPFFDIYPGMLQLSSLPLHLQPSEIAINSYPMLNLYPPVYLEIYPSTIKPNAYPQLQFTITSESQLSSIHSRSYPVFDLYPAIYPHFNLYPSVSLPDPCRIDDPTPLDFLYSYPTLSLYLPVYPHFELYLSRLEDFPNSKVVTLPIPVDVHLNHRYPIIDIYPSVYPYLKIYPTYPTNYLNSKYPHAAESPTVASPSITESRTYSRPRYTHTQLREQVPTERVSKSGRKKSHRDLHYSVFPNGLVSTPSGTTYLLVESRHDYESSRSTQLLKAAFQVQGHLSMKSSLLSDEFLRLPAIMHYR